MKRYLTQAWSKVSNDLNDDKSFVFRRNAIAHAARRIGATHSLHRWRVWDTKRNDLVVEMRKLLHIPQ
jgi:hypothetical protein